MSATLPITVGIPTYQRGDRVLEVLRRMDACEPRPSQVIVFLDGEDVGLETRIRQSFPSVATLSSKDRVGPGGGRHRMLEAATQPWFVSFDDDSWPMDSDFFALLHRHTEADGMEDVAVLATVIHHLEQERPKKEECVMTVSDYTGCGHAMRVSAYRSISGYVDRPQAYGLEERDVALQLHSAGWRVLRCGNLQVFHDTRLLHHNKASVAAATIENAALLGWLRYPVLLWPYALLQFANVVRFMIVKARFDGILRGILGAPLAIWQHRHLRRPLSAKAVVSYLVSRNQA